MKQATAQRMRQRVYAKKATQSESRRAKTAKQRQQLLDITGACSWLKERTKKVTEEEKKKGEGGAVLTLGILTRAPPDPSGESERTTPGVGNCPD